MKTASVALTNHLANNNQFTMAELLTITLLSGAILRYTAFDIPVTANGFTYANNGPLFQRSKIRTLVGVEIDKLTLTIWPAPTHLIGSIPFLQAANKGQLDGATVKLERAFLSAPTVVVGTVILFSGRVSELTMSASEVVVQVNSDTELLNIMMPRNLYQPGCLHTLYDTDCTVVRATYAVTGSVTSATTVAVVSALAQAAGHFDLGYVQFTSGQNNGLKRTVKAYAPGVNFTLLNPLPFAPAPGDTFTIYPGCDKRQSTCTTKFNNVINFRGFPFVPSPETTR